MLSNQTKRLLDIIKSGLMQYMTDDQKNNLPAFSPELIIAITKVVDILKECPIFLSALTAQVITLHPELVEEHQIEPIPDPPLGDFGPELVIKSNPGLPESPMEIKINKGRWK